MTDTRDPFAALVAALDGVGLAPGDERLLRLIAGAGEAAVADAVGLFARIRLAPLSHPRPAPVRIPGEPRTVRDAYDGLLPAGMGHRAPQPTVPDQSHPGRVRGYLTDTEARIKALPGGGSNG